jgi:hypothetical protein
LSTGRTRKIGVQVRTEEGVGEGKTSVTIASPACKSWAFAASNEEPIFTWTERAGPTTGGAAGTLTPENTTRVTLRGWKLATVELLLITSILLKQEKK